jgi:tetratricopeptide (TPR) repeat protein
MRNRMSRSASLAWVALASCVLPLSLSATTASTRQTADDAQFQAAMAAQDRGDLEQARTILIKLRRLHPGNFAVDESLGMVYVAQHKFAEALPFLEEAARVQPSSDAAQANLGAALYRVHRNAEALFAFRRAAQLNPANPETQQSLGELLLDAGQPREAAGAFAQAMRLKKNDPALTLEYASALVAAADLDQAEQAVIALPGSDNSAEAHAVLGEIDEKRGNYRAAANHFARAAELDPSEAHVWALGVEFLRHWTFDAAIREFQAGAVDFPASTRMKLGLATAYFGAGKYGEAIPVFAALLQQDKDNHLDAEMLGMACTAVSSAGKDDCSTLIAYAQSHPRDARAAAYATTLLLTENAGPAEIAIGRKLLNQAIRTDPRLPEAQYLMGLVRQQDGDWSGSIANLEAALQAKPQLAQAHYRLALAYWRTGRKQEAQLEAALQKKYAQAQQQDLDRRLREITTLIVDVRN